MNNSDNSLISQIKQKIDSSQNILFLIPQNHTVDALASSLAFYLSLKNTDKNITIATSTQITVAYQRLYGVGDIQNQLGSKSLVITLNTNYDNIEKVTYDNDNNKFNLVIETKEKTKKLDQEDISYSRRGLDADLIISLDFVTQEDAGDLLVKEPNLFSDRENIVITNKPQAIEFGNLNLKDPQASSVSELITKILRFNKMEIDKDIATNLIAGIESATRNFSQKASAETFAAVSFLMKKRGQRNHLNPQPVVQKPSVFPKNNSAKAFVPQKNPTSNQTVQPQTQNDQNQNQDWYEPKIYRGSTKV